MKTFTYDKTGLGFAEMTYLAMNKAFIFGLVVWMINHNLGKLALTLVRRII